MPLSRVTRVTDGLLEEGYLLKGRRKKNVLKRRWDYPKGQQCLEKETIVLQNFYVWFLVLMEALQKKNACAIEHILDERILTGIRMFMESRHTYSYMTRGNEFKSDVSRKERGSCRSHFLKKGTSHPRILSKRIPAV